MKPSASMHTERNFLLRPGVCKGAGHLVQSGFLPRDHHALSPLAKPAHGTERIAKAVLAKQHQHAAHGIRHLPGPTKETAAAACSVAVIIDRRVAGLRRRSRAMRKDLRRVAPTRIENRKERLQSQLSGRTARLCLSQRAFISRADVCSILPPSAAISASTARKRPTNFRVALASDVSASTPTLRARLTTLKRRSPNSSSILPFVPPEIASSQFLDFLLNLVKNLRDVIPVESDPRCFLLRILRQKERRKRRGQTVHHRRLLAFLRALDQLPLPDDLRAF